MADQVTLGLRATEITENLQLMHALDTFGDHVETQRSTHGHDRAHQRAVIGVVGDSVYECPVDLDSL